jgi:hypothetical protein
MKPSSVNVKFLAETFSGDSSDTVVPAVFNRTASVQNTHIDMWSLSVTDPTLVQTSPSCVYSKRVCCNKRSNNGSEQVPSLCGDQRQDGHVELRRCQALRPAFMSWERDWIDGPRPCI